MQTSIQTKNNSASTYNFCFWRKHSILDVSTYACCATTKQSLLTALYLGIRHLCRVNILNISKQWGEEERSGATRTTALICVLYWLRTKLWMRFVNENGKKLDRLNWFESSERRRRIEEENIFATSQRPNTPQVLIAAWRSHELQWRHR